VHADTSDADQVRVMTIEAFADTIVPGEKRWPDDRAVSGAAAGGGAVAAGALELLEHPASGYAAVLEPLAGALNAHASRYAEEQGRALDPSVPPFVALEHADRTRLLQELLAVDHPEKEMWVGLALFSNMAFDSAAHMGTHAALAAGHPGLLTIGYHRPDADGLWRFPEYSYGRPLAPLHPHTTSTGSPA
jgi:enediyne biosynthesis protein E8